MIDRLLDSDPAIRWQTPDGQWAGGACFPSDFRADFSAGQP